MAYEVPYMKKISHKITNAEYNLIMDLSVSGKVPAVKFIRNQYNVSLYDAKCICDAVWNNEGICVPAIE